MTLNGSFKVTNTRRSIHDFLLMACIERVSYCTVSKKILPLNPQEKREIANEIGLIETSRSREHDGDGLRNSEAVSRTREILCPLMRRHDDAFR